MSSNPGTTLLKWMGLSQPGKTSSDPSWGDDNERYCNSVLQALYYCKPFREIVNNFPNGPGSTTFILAPSSAGSISVPSSPPSGSFSSLSSNGPSSQLTPKPVLKQSRGGPPPSINGGTAAAVAAAAAAAAAEKEAAKSGSQDLQNLMVVVPGMEDTMFSSLKDLFWRISSQKKKTGVVAPNAFVNKLKKENELFRSSMHQDAHEFLNYLLNAIAENVEDYHRKIAAAEQQVRRERSVDNSSMGESSSEESGQVDDNSLSGSASSSIASNQSSTWVHQLFEGVFSNETKCLTCETVTSRDEAFLDLSIDIEMNSSVTSCLRQFSASETLCHKDKYFCDVCCGLQEAERRMKIKKLPNILALHLKRFKYQEQLQKYIKLTYRVVFPFELKLFNTCDDTQDPDRMYELWAIVVHIGSGPYHGHYQTVIKSNGQWLLFDDDIVQPIDEADIQKYFGDLPGTGSGYVLFYQSVNLDLSALGLTTEQWVSSGTVSQDGSASVTEANGVVYGAMLENGHPLSSVPYNLSDPYVGLMVNGVPVAATTATPEATLVLSKRKDEEKREDKEKIEMEKRELANAKEREESADEKKSSTTSDEVSANQAALREKGAFWRSASRRGKKDKRREDSIAERPAVPLSNGKTGSFAAA
ncbi:hypothetical protein BC937DRAFT_87821 [Endogone sp. FLAS-F59071]|nr:hypothetical protein BC937DRAFT_87821 [Endogone sp. FLAS-F59071]|eukprot:RUS19216.1 hypothetical protein BC937DRAFT_87821 [Endogone sp. FLAS-F59071]